MSIMGRTAQKATPRCAASFVYLVVYQPQSIALLPFITLLTTAPATAPREKLHGLNHLRALAIILVFFFHYGIVTGGQPAWLPPVAAFGWIGVDLFFVLSGFLIASQLFIQIREASPISWTQFFVKRGFRILPAFWCTLALYFCFPLFREKEALPPLWKFLSFTQNFGLDLKQFGSFSHAWSLCVEEHFYLLLPATLFILQKKSALKYACWLLPGFFIIGFAARLYCYEALYLPHASQANAGFYWYQLIYYLTYNRLDGLLAGVSIAALYVFRPNSFQRLAKYGNLLLLTGLLLLTAAYFLCRQQQTMAASVFGFPLIAVSFGFIVAGAVSSSSLLYKWQSAFTTKLATLSYGMYLTHKAIIHLTHQLPAAWITNEQIMLLLSMVTSFVAAWLLYSFVEKPFMQYRYRLLVKSTASPARSKLPGNK